MLRRQFSSGKQSSIADENAGSCALTSHPQTWNDNGKLTATGDAPEDYLTSVIGNRTMQWLNNATQSSQPWMAYVAVHAPHLPATPAPWYANASLPGDKAPRTPNYNFGWQDKHWEIDNGIDKPMDKVRQDATDALWASVSFASGTLWHRQLMWLLRSLERSVPAFCDCTCSGCAPS